MTGFWDKMRGKAATADAAPPDTETALLLRFADYPPDRPRHPGDPLTLSEAERDANLAQFRDERAARLAIVGNFLRDNGVDPAPMLDPNGDGVAAARAADHWLDETLPRRPFSPVSGDETPNPPDRAFRASDRAGADIYYSLLADLALLEGEAIRLRDARFDWAINRLPDFADMGSYGRICLIKPRDAAWPATVLEMDVHLLAICHAKMAPRGNGSGHWFGELLQGAVDRAYDPR